jgi:subtilisin
MRKIFPSFFNDDEKNSTNLPQIRMIKKKTLSSILCFMIISSSLALTTSIPPAAFSQGTAVPDQGGNITTPEGTSDELEIIPDQYIVVLKENIGVQPESIAKELVDRYGEALIILHVYTLPPQGLAIQTSNQTIVNEIENDPRVEAIGQDIMQHPSAIPPCPPNPVGPTTDFSSQQCEPTGVDRVDAEPSFNLPETGERAVRSVPVDIAIIDTGIDLQHPDLNIVHDRDCRAVSQVRIISSGAFFPACLLSRQGTSGDDDNDHGTHVAGIAAARDNNIGVVGVAPGASLWAIKVCTNVVTPPGQANCPTSDIVAALQYIRISGGVEVINISILMGFLSDWASGAVSNPTARFYFDTLRATVQSGITIVVSANNQGQQPANMFAPAGHPDVITVSAITDSDGRCGEPSGDDTFAFYSNFGNGVTIAAPGTNILSTVRMDDPNFNGYAYLSGTSMAAPHVAGAAAFYIFQHPGKPPAEVRQGIVNAGTTPSDVCDRSLNNGLGYFTGDIDGIPEPLLYLARLYPPLTTVETTPP